MSRFLCEDCIKYQTANIWRNQSKTDTASAKSLEIFHKYTIKQTNIAICHIFTAKLQQNLLIYGIFNVHQIQSLKLMFSMIAFVFDDISDAAGHLRVI